MAKIKIGDKEFEDINKAQDYLNHISKNIRYDPLIEKLLDAYTISINTDKIYKNLQENLPQFTKRDLSYILHDLNIEDILLPKLDIEIVFTEKYNMLYSKYHTEIGAREDLDISNIIDNIWVSDMSYSDCDYYLFEVTDNNKT
jgi:hypothetical protein